MDRLDLSEAEWRQRLTPEQYHILREAGTERAFSGALNYNKDEGLYRCAGCATPLFSSDAKYDSGSGWPSFFEPLDDGSLTLVEDTSHGMRRVEVRCACCDGHLGHVFPDGPGPTGTRFCMNSASLSFDAQKD
jgi:peptide-methionine (R)-S-oxide reductase